MSKEGVQFRRHSRRVFHVDKYCKILLIIALKGEYYGENMSWSYQKYREKHSEFVIPVVKDITLLFCGQLHFTKLDFSGNIYLYKYLTSIYTYACVRLFNLLCLFTGF